MILYHGSINKFDKFDYSFITKNNGTDEGYGFYFTDNKALAEAYANNGYLYTVSVELKGSLSENSVTLNTKTIKELILLINKEVDILNDYADVSYNGIEYALDVAIDTLSYNKNDVDIICDLCNASGDKEAVLKAISKIGYNHIHSVNNKCAKNRDDLSIYVMLNNDDINIVNINAIQ